MTLPPAAARWAAPVLLIALPLAFFWRVTVASEVVYWGTPLLQFYPWRTLAVQAYRAGQLPLWNPWSDFGAPLAANLQTAAFSPLNIIYLVLPVDTAMGWTIVIHVALAGLFMYWLGRILGLSTGAALFAAIAYMFSGFVISRAGFLSMTAVAPWFPAVLAATELTLRAAAAQRPRAHLIALLALATGMLHLAGHIQLAFYTLLVAAAYALLRAALLLRAKGAGIPQDIAGRASVSSTAWPDATPRPPDPSPPLPAPGGGGHQTSSPLQGVASALQNRRVHPNDTTGATADHHSFTLSATSIRTHALGYVSWLLPVALAIVLGTGLAAVQLLPTAELTLHSHRRDGPGYDYAMNYSLYPFQLAQVLAPDVLGSPVTGDYRGPGNYWEGTSYLGALTVLLMLIGARFSGHPLRWSLLALAAAAWVFALGRHSPVYPWVFANVPGFGLFQAPARFLYWWALAGALLAGLGMDVLLARGGDPRLRRWKNLPLGAAAGIGGGVAAALAVLGPASVAGSSLAALLKAAGLLIVSAGLLTLAPRLGRGFPSAAAALLFLDLFAFGHALNPVTSPDLYRTPLTPAVAPQGELPARIFISDEEFEGRFGAIFGFRDFGSHRAEDLLPVRQTLYPNLGALAGVADAMNYDPLKLERSWQLRALADRASSGPDPLLQMMGVGAVFDRTGRVRQVASPYPRAWFAPEAVAASGLADARVKLASADPLRTAVVEAPADALPRPSGATPAVTRIAARDGIVAAVETEGAADGLLVVAESWYPGWAARLDGRAAPVYPVNLAFRAVVVPAGRHRIEFAYEPASVKAGLGVSAASLAVTLGLAAGTLRRRRDGA